MNGWNLEIVLKLTERVGNDNGTSEQNSINISGALVGLTGWEALLEALGCWFWWVYPSSE